jgi:peptidoglycan/xylan/chitin deacetylase (PgdA/CDA1 family)
MDILDRLRVRASVTINAEACLRYPQIVEEAKKRSWEFLGHGRTNSELLRGLPQEEERGLIKQCIDAITATTGQAPRGWLGPALAESDFTPDLLAEAGITYVCDWCNDDQPYWMRTTSGRLMSVPYSIEINDIPAVLGLGKSSEEFCKMVRDQFDVLHAEGQRAARVMAVALHPFIMGQPFRSLHLENVLQYIVAQEGVWMTTGGEIADWFAGASGSI